MAPHSHRFGEDTDPQINELPWHDFEDFSALSKRIFDILRAHGSNESYPSNDL
jgi:hypothetical protein